MKLLLACAPILALFACTTAPKWAGTNYPQRTVAQTYDQQAADKCTNDINAAAGDTQKMLAVRLGCGTYLSEVFQGKINKTTGAVRATIGYIDYSKPYTADGWPATAQTPYLTLAQVGQYMDAIRAQMPKTTIPIANGDKIETAYAALTVVARNGSRVTLSSVESYLAHAIQNEAAYGEPDANGEIAIDPFFFDSANVNWVFNNTISYTELTSNPGAKFDNPQAYVVSWNGSTLRPIQSITEIVPEAQLLASLKTDYIIRNSDVWDKVKNATSLKAFIAAFPTKEYSEHHFLSYSTRLSKADQKKAVACALNVGKPGVAPDQAGIRCLRKNNVILYDYSFDTDALKRTFSILEADRSHLRVKVPFIGLGNPVLRFDVPVSQNSYVHYVSVDGFLAGEAQKYSQNHCRVKTSEYSELIEASSPALLNFPSCQ